MRLGVVSFQNLTNEFLSTTPLFDSDDDDLAFLLVIGMDRLILSPRATREGEGESLKERSERKAVDRVAPPAPKTSPL